MKKSLAMLCGLLAAAACTKEAPMENNAPVAEKSSIKFEITVNPLTKASKDAWEDGDAVFLFFKGSTQTYLKLSRVSGSWEYALTGSDSDVTGATDKKLTAVFMPFASAVTPVYDNGWKFQNNGLDIMSYFMTDENVSYTTDVDEDNNTVVQASVTVRNNVANSVQFYVVDPDAGNTTADGSYTYSLFNDTVKPFGFGAVNADGTVSAVEGNCGDPMPGYVYNNGTETGYLFSGLVGNSDAEQAIVAEMPTGEYDYDEEDNLIPIWGNGGYGYLFLLSDAENIEDAEHTYGKFNALKNVIAPHSALKLGNLKETDATKKCWWELGEGHGAVAQFDQVFSTVNYGAKWPWDNGNFYNFYEAVALELPEGWKLPDGNVNTQGIGGGDLGTLDGTTYHMDIKGKECYVIVNGSSFLILPSAGIDFPWGTGHGNGVYFWYGSIIYESYGNITTWYYSNGDSGMYINEAYKNNLTDFRMPIRLVPVDQ